MKRPRIGTIGLLTVTTRKIGPYLLPNAHFTNNVGGTANVPPATYRVKITRTFVDDETGRVLHAEVLDKPGIERLRKAGTTEFGPEHYKQYETVNPRLYIGAKIAQAKFCNPPILYFHAGKFKDGVTWIEEESAKPARRTKTS